MGMTQAHLNAHHVAKADAAMAIAIAARNQQKIDKANNAAETNTGKWLSNEHQLLQNGVNDARSALFLAAQFYDEVMAAQMKPKVFDAVLKSFLIGLTLVNPELGLLANVLQLGDEKEKEQRQERAKRIMGGVDLIKEAIEAGAEANEAKENLERHETTLHAKTEAIRKKVEELSETSDFLTTALNACQLQVSKLVDNATGPVSAAAFENVKSAWNALVGGPARHYREGMDTQLALLMLYEMMREHCRTNVRLVMQIGSIKRPLSRKEAQQLVANDKGQLIEFEGLDPAKREDMYDKFELIDKWGDRDVITKEEGGYKALINSKDWEFKS